MATTFNTIEECLEVILNSIYGSNMRVAIHDGIELSTNTYDHTTNIHFTEDGFGLTFENYSGKKFYNEFQIMEDSKGNITGIVNKTTKTTIEVTYD